MNQTNLPQDSIIILHASSIGNILGAVVVAIFLFYSLVYGLFDRRNQTVRYFALLQISMLMILAGAGLYISSPEASTNFFWSRIVYTGVALIPLAFNCLVGALIGRPQPRINWIFFVFLAVSTAVIWLDDQWLITRELRLAVRTGNPYMVKGPAFPYFLTFVFVSGLGSYFAFIRYFLTNAEFRRLGWPLAVGFSVWMATGLYDGLAAMGLILPRIIFWLGPVVMAIMAGFFLAQIIHKHNLALEEAMAEKDRIYQLLIRDELTGLFSRSYLVHVLRQELSLLGRREIEHCLLFIDLDNFKAVNDRLGHRVGDNLLGALGVILTDICRKSDVPARFGGDEFIVLLRECSEDRAIAAARRIHRRCRAELEHWAKTFDGLKVGLSIGLSSSRHWANDLNEILEQPDQAMYAAKRSGEEVIGIYGGPPPGDGSAPPEVRLVASSISADPRPADNQACQCTSSAKKK